MVDIWGFTVKLNIACWKFSINIRKHSVTCYVFVFIATFLILARGTIDIILPIMVVTRSFLLQLICLNKKGTQGR